MKKTLALLLAIVMVMTSAFTVFASDAAVDTTTPAYATEPEAGVAYKFVVEQGNNGTTNYLTGATANTAYYLATSTDINAGVDVYLEEVEGGYQMYFIVEGAKKYITIAANGTYVNAGFVDADACVFTWNTTYNTLTTVVNDTEYYLGSYNNYDTVSASKITYAATSFVGQLLKVETTVETEPAATESATVESQPAETEPAVETELVPMYKGDLANGVQYGGANPTGNSIGQLLTIPEGKYLVSITYSFTYTYGAGDQDCALTIWDSAEKTNVLYEGVAKFKDNTANNTAIVIDGDTKITGTIYYEIQAPEGVRIAVGGSIDGAADGVTNYYNGAANVGRGFWGANIGPGSGIASTLAVAADPDYVPETEPAVSDTEPATTETTEAPETEATPVEILMYGNTEPYNNMCWSGSATKSFGQTLTVADGKLVTSIGVTFGGSAGKAATFKVYRWDTDYLTTVASEPLYTQEITISVNTWQEYAVPNLGGALYWEVASVDGNVLTASAYGAYGNITETADGVVTNIHRVFNGEIDAPFVGWSQAEAMKTKIMVIDDPNYVPPETTETEPATTEPVVEAEDINLHNGDRIANFGINKLPTVNFGQAFTVPAGKELVKLTIFFQCASDPDNDTKPDAPGKFMLYKWEGSYAASIAAEPLYVVEEFTAYSDWYTFEFETAYTGDLLWIVENLDEYNNWGPSAASSATDAVITHIVDGAEKKNTGGWGGNSFPVVMSVVVDPDYVPPVVTEPADETTTEPADETTEPADETTTEPADETTTEPADETTTEPADETTEPADETTTEPADETTEPDTTAADTTAADTTAAAEGGCGSVVGSAAAVAVIAIAGAAAVVLKKKKED